MPGQAEDIVGGRGNRKTFALCEFYDSTSFSNADPSTIPSDYSTESFRFTADSPQRFSYRSNVSFIHLPCSIPIVLGNLFT